MFATLSILSTSFYIRLIKTNPGRFKHVEWYNDKKVIAFVYKENKNWTRFSTLLNRSELIKGNK